MSTSKAKGSVLLSLCASLACGSSASHADVLTDALAAMPPNSWQKLNLNQFQDAWTPDAQRPTTASPSSNISAWSGAAWNNRRKQLLIWGGDIGDEEGNEVYLFDTTIGTWKRGSLPSQITTTNGVPHAIDGIFNAPTSGESWDNVVYLPNVDRMAVMGVSREGRTFRDLNGDSTGPYFWNPTKADPNKVSGTTGSQVNPTAFPGVTGGQMWQNRDNFPSDIGLGLMGTTAHTSTNGKDVVYFTGGYDYLYRYTVSDLNPANDTWELIGRRTMSGKDGSGSSAFDPTQQILVKTLWPNSFGYWDVSAQATSPENREVEVVPTVISSGVAPDNLGFYGMQYDPTLRGFVVWGGDSNVWLLDPPDNLDPDGDGLKTLDTGWTLKLLSPNGTGPKRPAEFTGVFGKWVYLPEEKAYLGVIDPVAGDVFVYKPSYSATPTDSTPPVIQSSAGGPQGNLGWYIGNVNVAWSVADPESPVTTTSGCGPTVVSSDFVNLPLTCNASSAGGQASRTVTIKRDATPPAASAAPTSLPNANGWYKSNVTVRTSGSDSTSGIASCSPDAIVSQEGANLSSPAGTCTDFAGNSSAAVVASSIRLDKTAPTVTATRNSSPKASGWTNTAVTVSFTAVDALSGVAVDGCDSSVTLTASGPGQTATGGCVDRAGNRGTTTLTNIDIDRVAPIAVATQSPVPNGNGWNNADVTVGFAATDSLPGSGVASCTPDRLISTEGSGIVTSGTCSDAAGNTSSTVSATTNLDKTRPAVTITAPRDGASYAKGSPLIADFACSDARSGVAQCAGSVADGASVDTSVTGTKTFTVQATDRAGNVTAVASTYSVIEQATASPTVQAVLSGTLGDNGWYTSNVSLAWLVSSPVTSTSGCANQSVTADTAGASYSCSATNATGTTTNAITIKRDAAAPAITITSPRKNARYSVGMRVTASYRCADSMSGIATQGCVGSEANGAVLDTRTPGTRTFVVTALDAAGLTSSATVTYSVR